MGTGIAAHLAGAGIKTHLLDIVPKDAGNKRNRLATEATAHAAQADQLAGLACDHWGYSARSGATSRGWKAFSALASPPIASVIVT